MSTNVLIQHYHWCKTVYILMDVPYAPFRDDCTCFGLLHSYMSMGIFDITKSRKHESFDRLRNGGLSNIKIFSSVEHLVPMPETIRSLLIMWSDQKFLASSQFFDQIGFHERSCLRSDHDPGTPARFVDRCWIRNFISTIGHFISNIAIVKIRKLPGNIH